MAPRSRKIKHDDETRARIQAAMIVNRLMDNIMGKVDLSPAQVSAAKTLLNKVLPDLSAVQHSGDPESPLEVVSRIELVAPSLPDDDSKD